MNKLLIVWALLASVAARAEDYHVYFLGGQSNMVGFGTNAELAPDQAAPVDGALIYVGQTLEDGARPTGAGAWLPLAPGFGTGFQTDGQTPTLSDRFGPELSFARRLRELRPGERIAIIKYARNGSGLDRRVDRFGCWDPNDDRGPNQYDHALATIARATGQADIDGDGEPDRLIPAGILWMQGESDATNPDTALDYRENLAELIGLLRAALRSRGLPVAIGRISDSGVHAGRARVWPHGEVVREAQAVVARDDDRARLVTSTDAYDYSDRYHYDTGGYLDFGRRFADAIDGLRGEPVR